MDEVKSKWDVVVEIGRTAQPRPYESVSVKMSYRQEGVSVDFAASMREGMREALSKAVDQAIEIELIHARSDE
jgi:hypothetical protein